VVFQSFWLASRSASCRQWGSFFLVCYCFSSLLFGWYVVLCWRCRSNHSRAMSHTQPTCLLLDPRSELQAIRHQSLMLLQPMSGNLGLYAPDVCSCPYECENMYSDVTELWRTFWLWTRLEFRAWEVVELWYTAHINVSLDMETRPRVHHQQTRWAVTWRSTALESGNVSYRTEGKGLPTARH
jgi:hypothetical protein